MLVFLFILLYNITMNIRNLFKCSPKKPKKRVLYAITNGSYMGVCVIFVKPEEHPKNGIYAAMAIGDKDFDGGMEAMEIPERDVNNGIKLGILDKIRTVPEELYILCCKEYTTRINKKNGNNYESTN